MDIKRSLAIVLFVILPAFATAQVRDSLSHIDLLHKVNPSLTRTIRSVSDSLPAEKNSVPVSLSDVERTNRLYDSLESYSERNTFWKLVDKLFIVPRRNPSNLSAQIVDEAAFFTPFAGKVIAEIEIDRVNVFERAVSYLEKGMNAVHMTTRQYAIKRDLLFSEGDKLDPQIIVLTKQLLRSRENISAVDFTVLPVPGDTTAVKLVIRTHDSWTIGGDGSITGLTGRVKGELYDANFLGSGNKFKYKLSLDWKQRRYEGSIFEYYIPNILGSFVNANFIAGRSFWETTYSAAFNKKFILPTDYEIGAEYTNKRTEIYVQYDHPEPYAESHQMHLENVDLWGGKSWENRSVNNSIYTIGRFNHVHFRKRPDVEKGLNPYFYNRSLYIASVGLYNEKFLTTNLIYGYGYDEYVATGYRSELTLGYMDSEFNPGWYGGGSVKSGGFTRLGYFMGEVAAGGYFNFNKREFFRSSIDFKLDYFTNLLGKRKFKVRQFASFNYVRGWDREGGYKEIVWFTSESGPRGLGANVMGTNRMVVNTETVVFTPWMPMGFRIALYGFIDAGWIGYDGHIFRNDFYSTIGIGIRLKNEMLIFDAIQFSLSFGLKGNNLIAPRDWIMLNTERRMNAMRYIPQKPQVIEYK